MDTFGEKKVPCTKCQVIWTLGLNSLLLAPTLVCALELGKEVTWALGLNSLLLAPTLVRVLELGKYKIKLCKIRQHSMNIH